MPDQSDFRYPTPTASPFDDPVQYIPLLLTAVEAALERLDVWPEGEEDTALGYVEDLKAWLMDNIGTEMSLPTSAIIPFGGTSVPSGWLLCDGSAVSRTTYATLFAAIGTTFGAGDGSTTFNLPKIPGRTLIGAGQGTGLTNRALGALVGTETETLSVDQIPSHSHSISETDGFYGGSDRPQRGTDNAVRGTANTNSTGGGSAHNNMQPSIALNFIIKV